MEVKKKKKGKRLKNRPNPLGKGTVTRERLRTKAPQLKKLIFQSSFIPFDIDKPTRMEDVLADIKQHSAIEKILFFGDETPAVSEEQIYDFCYDCVAQGKDELMRKMRMKGSPTTYKPWIHIPMVLNRMSRGCSQTELALEIGVLPAMIHRWKNQFPSFRQAIEEGHKLAEAWWMKVGRANLANSKFNNNLYSHQMAIRFGHSVKNVNVNVKGNVRHNYTGNVKHVHEHSHTIVTLRDRIQNMPIKELEELSRLLGVTAPQLEPPPDYKEIDFEKEAEDAIPVDVIGEPTDEHDR
jgi:hypothetical protein